MLIWMMLVDSLCSAYAAFLSSRDTDLLEPNEWTHATDIFSRDSRFVLELARHSVNYSNASFLTLRGLAYTFPSEFPNYT